MPIPPRVTTFALVSATVLTAVGLNLTVMQRTADSGGSVTASSGAEATSGDQPATEQAVPVDGASAPSAEALIGSPAGDGNGPALDVAARFTQAPSDATPAGETFVATPAPAAVDLSASAPASSTPASSTSASSTPATPAQPMAASPPAGPAPSTAPAPATSAPTASSSPPTAPPSIAVTRPATTSAPATSAGSNTQPPATEYVTIEFTGVADVVIAFHNRSTVEFWAAWPEPGWSYVVEEDRPSGVKIKFRPSSGGDEAELSIRPEGGELRVKKEH